MNCEEIKNEWKKVKMVALETIKSRSTKQKMFTNIKNNKKAKSWKRLIDIGLNWKGSLEKDYL